MDWDKLRIFQAVATAGSFTHAGERLGLSQSAISRQISTLEETLGTSLFHRHARGLILTEQGEILHKTAQDIFSQLAMIQGKLLDTKQKPEGPLLITTAGFLGTSWLAPLLATFNAENPNIQLTLIQSDKVLNLGMREADAALRLFRPEQPDLVQKPLFSLPIYMCASKSYIEAHGAPKSINDLAGHNLLGFPNNFAFPYDNPNWHFAAANLDVDTYSKRTLINSVLGLWEACRHGLGIAAIPSYLINRDPNLVPLLVKEASHQVTGYFVYPEEHRHSRRIQIFRDYLQENAKEIEKSFSA